jgi:hypothetical protein
MTEGIAMTTRTRRNGPGSFAIETLVEAVAEASEAPRYARLKPMLTRHHQVKKVLKAPVYVGLYIAPGSYPVIWQELVPPDNLVSQMPLEREIELQLRQRLYKHESIPDDDVLNPTVWIRPVPPGGGKRSTPMQRDGSGEHVDGAEAARLWGLPMRTANTNAVGGAYKVVPVVESEADMERLHAPRYEVDEAATAERLERAREIVGERLDVKIWSDEVGFAPSEVMVSLMGIEAVLYGVVDRPEFIHAMMDRITTGSIDYHKQREQAGAVLAESSWYYRAHYEGLPTGADSTRLENCWEAVSAQSLCGLSPAMYAEFLQPYHERLANLSGGRRVYYHACEDITKKIPIIRQLPNLGRLHISPWTDLEKAVDQLGQSFVLETEAHTADTIFLHTREQMRERIEWIISVAGDSIFDINLTAIETTNGNPSVLTTWASIAQEVTARHA